MGKFGKFAQKLWDVERPYLDNVIYHKGYRKNLYPKGSAPPFQYASKDGLMKLYHRVETKKPAHGYVSAYRKRNEHTAPLPPGRKPGSHKPMTKNYEHPLRGPVSKKSFKNYGPSKPIASAAAPAKKRVMTDAQLAKKIMTSKLTPGSKLKK